jgi:hypothetical protein
MYCEVEFPDSSSASSTNASLWRFPPRLHFAPPANESFTFHASGNILRVDLTIMNLTGYDAADYTFTVGECSFVCAKISLHVDECLGIQPTPVTQQNISVTAPLSASSVTLIANFTGETSGLTYPIVFSNQSVIDLPFHDSNKYSYRSKVYPNCVLSVVLVIHNLSMADTGVYMAQAMGRGYSSPQVLFHVKVIDPGLEENLLKLISILAVVIVLLPVVFCAAMYVSRRNKKIRTYNMHNSNHYDSNHHGLLSQLQTNHSG